MPRTKAPKHSTLPLNSVSPNGLTVRANLEARIDALPFFDPTRRVLAATYGLTHYVDYCDTHGAAPHGSATGRCVRCPTPETVLRDRKTARREGLRRYLDVCPIHGETDHSTTYGKCLTCFTSAGLLRAADPSRRGPLPSDSPRAVARRAGEASFLDECPHHGRVAHAVRNGVCLTCRTVDGHARLTSRGRPLTEGARAAARRAGQTTYVGKCETHGETAHSVLRGKCLTCFNALGLRRPGQ